MLFSPMQIGALHLANRIVIAPMCQYSAQQGMATSWHTIHYGQFAISGAGLLVVEATAVEPEGRISPHDLGLWSDETEASLQNMLAAVRPYSAMPIGVQLAHAGRKASQAAPWDGGHMLSPAQGGWQPFAPSALAYDATCEIPAVLDEAGIDRIKTRFAQSAQRAARAGFDSVEVHCAHGYLLHEFLSPLTNQRTDTYGGTLTNRMRLPLEVFELVRDAFPENKPVGVRISATDWVAGGWNIEESVMLAHELKRLGCAYIHVSGGGLSPNQQLAPCPGYQVEYAARIKAETGLTTIAVGLITEPEQAETILTTGQADMIGLGRAMMYDPRWPWHAAAQLHESIPGQPQYLRSVPRHAKGLFAG